MVVAFARAGANVGINYHRSREAAEALAAECTALGVKAVAAQADVTSEDGVAGLKAVVEDALGGVDIVVTNAVIQYEWTSVLKQSVDDYASQFQSSVLHSVLMAKAFAPAMQEKGWGRIIGVNTECSMQCWEGQSAYVSGKRGMDGVLRVLAREVGAHGVTVNQVAPGWIVSEKKPDDDSQGQVEYKMNVPLKRRGYPEEVANAVLFLASEEARFITGAFLPVCGGNVMPAI
jgi:3-oxoacyl-[acyl-carrier protein] reductase